MQGEASFEPFHTASNEGGEEALPQGCQEQVILLYEYMTILRKDASLLQLMQPCHIQSKEGA